MDFPIPQSTAHAVCLQHHIAIVSPKPSRRHRRRPGRHHQPLGGNNSEVCELTVPRFLASPLQPVGQLRGKRGLVSVSSSWGRRTSRVKVPCCRMQEHATPSTALQVLNQGAKVQSCRPRRRRQFGTSASQCPMLILVGLGFTRVFAWCFVWFQYDETFRSVRHFFMDAMCKKNFVPSLCDLSVVWFLKQLQKKLLAARISKWEISIESRMYWLELPVEPSWIRLVILTSYRAESGQYPSLALMLKLEA